MTKEFDALSDDVQNSLRHIADEAYVARGLATGPWGRGEFIEEPSRLAVQTQLENFAKHLQTILDALKKIGVPGVE